MTNGWAWWAGTNEEEFTLAGPCGSRHEALCDAYGDTAPGDTIFLIEAITAHEGERDLESGIIPFVQMRNQSHEIRGYDQPRAEGDRSPAQFFFEIGFGACLAEGYVRNGAFAFEATDALIDRAWKVAGEAHEDPDEFERYRWLADGGSTPTAEPASNPCRLPADIDADHIRRSIAHIAKAAHAIGWQAGVGGMETAGAIVSYLANHPEHIGPFFRDEVSPMDWLDFVDGGCLTWHAQKGGKIVHPSEVRAYPLPQGEK